MKRKFSTSSDSGDNCSVEGAGTGMLEAHEVGWRHKLEKNVYIEMIFILPIFVNCFALMISHFGQKDSAFRDVHNIAYFCVVISFLEVCMCSMYGHTLFTYV